MRHLTVMISLSACLLSPCMSNAKGCIKGAAVGGVAGHVAGHHAVAGAAAGCVIGHHEATVRDREAARAAAQARTRPAGQAGSSPNQ